VLEARDELCEDYLYKTLAKHQGRREGWEGRGRRG